MLRIFYLLECFFKDAYKEISVRKYAGEMKLSPPTASKILKGFEKENILLSSKKGIYLYFRPNNDNLLFQGLAKLYWQSILFDETAELHKQVLFQKIILFGSLAKAENTPDSDVDLYVDVEKKSIDAAKIEKKLKRKIQLHFRDSMKNPHLKKNIENGIRIR